MYMTSIGTVLRFAQSDDPKLKAGAKLLSAHPAILDRLWAGDAGGDMLIAGMTMVATIGPLKNPSTLGALLDVFPEWWELNPNDARTIGQKLDAALEADALDEIQSDLCTIAQYLLDNDSGAGTTMQQTWQELKASADSWQLQDSDWMMTHPAQWSSELTKGVYTYYVIDPIQTTAELLNAGERVIKELKNRTIQEEAAVGKLQLFTVAEVLKDAESPVAVIAISNVDGVWVPAKVYSKELVPQSLYHLAHQLAERYTSRCKTKAVTDKTKAVLKKLNVASILQGVLDHARSALTSKSPNNRTDANLPTTNPTGVQPRSCFIDTCTLLAPEELWATRNYLEKTPCQVIIVSAVVDELERKKATHPTLVREANAALRYLEQSVTEGKAVVEPPVTALPHRPYADQEILDSIGRSIGMGNAVTLITADIALRIRARALYPSITAMDSRAMVPTHQLARNQPTPQQTNQGSWGAKRTPWMRTPRPYPNT